MRRPQPARALATAVLLGLAGAGLAQEHGAGAAGGDLAAVRARGVLRHLGVAYADFVTGGGDGFDVELVPICFPDAFGAAGAGGR